MKRGLFPDGIDDLLREGRFDEAMGTPLGKRDGKRKLEDLFSREGGGAPAAEDALYGALTLGDLVYDLCRIDPDVIAACDFSRKEDISNALAFSSFAEEHRELVGEARSGLVSGIHGYVAERVVAHHYAALGHDVTFPDASNQEGWDLLIDGKPFQVKCLNDASGVYEHLERHEYPVIVNAELHDSVAHLPGVYVDYALHHDQVRDATSEALEAGEDATDFEVPWISLAVSSASALRDLVNGDTDFMGACTNAVTNTAGRILFGTLGGKAASAVGLFLLGPAAGIVFGAAGSVLGAAGGRRIAAMGRRSLVSGDYDAFINSARRLAVRSTGSLEEKLKTWGEKKELICVKLAGARGNKPAVERFMVRKMDDDIRYFRNKRNEFDEIARSRNFLVNGAHDLWERLVRMIRKAGIHPSNIQSELEEFNTSYVALDAAKRRFRV